MRKKTQGEKQFRGLNGFYYYKLDNKFKFTLRELEDGDKDRIGESKWNGISIKERISNEIGRLDFDSGIICAETLTPVCSDVFLASYRLFKATIGNVIGSKSYNMQPETSEEIAIGIGMVLSLIAKKGSAEKNNRVPYLLMIKRKNAAVRNDQLDASIVEGLSRSDFDKNYTIKGFDGLNRIAERALAEERGLNCKMLTELGLLQLPEVYYLGYDREYHQWNFFGTVVVDCTIEEIIREGCYFTKDKFETSEIFGFPIEPNELFFHLSDTNVLHGKKDESGIPVDGMWNTGWASVCFAVEDFCKKTPFLSRSFVLFLKRFDTHGLYKRGRLMNGIAEWFSNRNHGFSVFAAVLSMILMILTLIWVWCPMRNLEGLTTSLTILSSFIALITCGLVLAISRSKQLKNREVVHVSTFWESEEIKNGLFPEIAPFRNVILLDGSIGGNPRFSSTKGENKGTIEVTRDCNIFDWRGWKWDLKKITDIGEQMTWRIVCPDPTSSEEFRVVVPCINTQNRTVYMKKVNEKLVHLVDIKIPYNLFNVTSTDDKIRVMLKNKIDNALKNSGIEITDIHYRFLLKTSKKPESEGMMVVVGFAETKRPFDESIIEAIQYPLGQYLNTTVIYDELRDDISRVACVYAAAEYLGYVMSER